MFGRGVRKKLLFHTWLSGVSSSQTTFPQRCTAIRAASDRFASMTTNFASGTTSYGNEISPTPKSTGSRYETSHRLESRVASNPRLNFCPLRQAL